MSQTWWLRNSNQSQAPALGNPYVGTVGRGAAPSEDRLSRVPRSPSGWRGSSVGRGCQRRWAQAWGVAPAGGPVAPGAPGGPGGGPGNEPGHRPAVPPAGQTLARRPAQQVLGHSVAAPGLWEHKRVGGSQDTCAKVCWAFTPPSFPVSAPSTRRLPRSVLRPWGPHPAEGRPAGPEGRGWDSRGGRGSLGTKVSKV